MILQLPDFRIIHAIQHAFFFSFHLIHIFSVMQDGTGVGCLCPSDSENRTMFLLTVSEIPSTVTVIPPTGLFQT